ncbi:MAG: PorP/SprF family type IX secretion system membrane protein [Flavobacteriaceae bacterium]
MNALSHITERKNYLIISIICLLFGLSATYGQENLTEISVNGTFHNQLFFNRFLINPTFSLVRENKSYINILHRNQYASFEDNAQNYYLGFSNKMNEHTALGIGVYGQWSGVMQEFGFNANYANSVRLGEKTSLTFGTNVSYLSGGIAQDRVVTPENDPTILDTRRENRIGIHPGIALSVGQFDFGLYAKDLIEYNQTSNELITGFATENVKASVQYSHLFAAAAGMFENGRMMPLLQVGQNAEGDLTYIGSILLDLPSYGWLQSTYDQTYGLSLGIGFNLSKQLSIGYLMEKNISDQSANLGWNHELSLAYTFKEDLSTPDGLFSSVDSKDAQIDMIIRNYEEQIADLKNQQQDQKGKKKDRQSTSVDKTAVAISTAQQQDNSLAMENRMILDELIWRQDSIEKARTAMYEKQFETIVRLMRNEIDVKTKDRFNRLTGVNYETATASIDDDIYVSKKKATTTAAKISTKLPARKDFKEIPIRNQNRSDIIGVDSGYYLIVNVYSNKRYLKAFVNKLNNEGLNARQFYNRKNGLYYVYLADFSTKDDARLAMASHLDGDYEDEKWILEIYESVATAAVQYEQR